MRGLLLQRLPSATADDDLTWARAAAGIDVLPPAELLVPRCAQDFLGAHFPDDDVRLFAARAARFACSCSEERVANALRTIGRAEVESILAEQGLVGVTCEFCNRQYTFVAEDARAIFAAERGAATRSGDAPDPMRH